MSDRTPAAGSTVKFCGSGFQPGENMEIRFVDLEMGAVVDASGEFCKSFPLVTEKGVAVTGPSASVPWEPLPGSRRLSTL